MTEPFDAFRIERRPLQLEYDDFIRCNDQCFEDEPISEDRFIWHRSRAFWAVYVGNSLVGYGIVVASEKRRRIIRVAICPEHQGRTYGQRLLSTMIVHGLDAGCDEFTLSVRQDNPVEIHIYQKAGFRTVGEQYQYVVDLRDLVHQTASATQASSYTIAQIIDYDPESLPVRMRRWYEKHRCPDRQVLMFSQRGVGLVGFCRLNPEFPGCSPFEVWRSDYELNGLVILLDDYLRPDKKRLKLAFEDANLAEAADQAGHTLNYKLFEMSLGRSRAQRAAAHGGPNSCQGL